MIRGIQSPSQNQRTTKFTKFTKNKISFVFFVSFVVDPADEKVAQESARLYLGAE
jgi:hypothetical protein